MRRAAVSLQRLCIGAHALSVFDQYAVVLGSWGALTIADVDPHLGGLGISARASPLGTSTR